MDCWKTAVGVDGEVLGLFDIGEESSDDGVREAKLLDYHGDFGGVWSTLAPDRDGSDLFGTHFRLMLFAKKRGVSRWAKLFVRCA